MCGRGAHYLAGGAGRRADPRSKRRGPGRPHRGSERARPGAPGLSAARPRKRPGPNGPANPRADPRARPARGPVSSGPNLVGARAGAGGARWRVGPRGPRGSGRLGGSEGSEGPPREHGKVRASELYASLYSGTIFLVLPWKVARSDAARARGGRARRGSLKVSASPRFLLRFPRGRGRGQALRRRFWTGACGVCVGGSWRHVGARGGGPGQRGGGLGRAQPRL